MAKSNKDKVGSALDVLKDGLMPFVESELRKTYGDDWEKQSTETMRYPPNGHWDVTAILNVMWENWQVCFREVLGHTDRSLVSEIRTVRNDWAHQKPLSSNDAYRALDSMARLLRSCTAGEAANELDRQASDIMRLQFAEQGRAESRKAKSQQTAGRPQAGLMPWREVVEPHEDVAGGNYLNAEFAADLHQVWKGEASSEYVDPVEFFRRTYLTQGLRDLLVNALKRLAGSGGDPVVALQTNFGGGKTHSMLALYHLFGEAAAAELSGIDDLLSELQIDEVPGVKRAVIVGQYMRPAEARTMADGTVTHTLWGDLAWQLAGAEGYALVAEADKKGISPGDRLIELFKLAGPSLILIDEWVSYARQLYEKRDLPAGSFETHFTFAQALTEAASAVPHVLLVVSVPASDIEVGGTAGKEALNRLENVVSRKEATWQPASTNEGFEIVRRRLFKPLLGDSNRKRDAAVRAFVEQYREKPKEFPVEATQADYEKRLAAAYPIHPDVFDRLYTEWSTLDRFQRTRGVLRLMAAVIHALWEREDKNLLILPGMLPIDDANVRKELTRYLDPAWTPIVETDVDGPDSSPLKIDQENNTLGRYSATRRVARTLFLGTAPMRGAAARGKDIRQVHLGCVQPGEALATFGDALRRLQNKAVYLNTDGERSYYDTAQNINREAESRKLNFTDDAVTEELRRVLREQQSHRGEFGRVHAAPSQSGDVADAMEAALVILGPDAVHSVNQEDSPAMQAADELLNKRGGGPRHFKNSLVFAAADKTRMADLLDAIRWLMAWRGIVDRQNELDLTPAQMRTAKAQCEVWDGTVRQRLPEAYCWMLVPTQAEAKESIKVQATRLAGDAMLAPRAADRLKRDEQLIAKLGPTRLRRELDKVPLWTGDGQDHVAVQTLAEYFSRYVYLPRLSSPQVLAQCISEGLGRLTWEAETFAYAEAKKADGTFSGLICGTNQNVSPDDPGLIVKADVAAAQHNASLAGAGAGAATGTDGVGSDNPSASSTSATSQDEPAPTRLPRRFHASADLDPERVARDVGLLSQEVLSHLVALEGARCNITLEIDVEAEDGVPADVQRVVSENSRTLKVRQFGFESE